jgi:adenosine deaminase
MGLGHEELARLQRNAFEAAFLTPGERSELLARARARGNPPGVAAARQGS